MYNYALIMKQELRKFTVSRWDGYTYNSVSQFDFKLWSVYSSDGKKVGTAERRKGSTLIFCFDAEGNKLGLGGVSQVNTAMAIIAEAHAKKSSAPKFAPQTPIEPSLEEKIGETKKLIIEAKKQGFPAKAAELAECLRQMEDLQKSQWEAENTESVGEAVQIPAAEDEEQCCQRAWEEQGDDNAHSSGWSSSEIRALIQFNREYASEADEPTAEEDHEALNMLAEEQERENAQRDWASQDEAELAKMAQELDEYNEMLAIEAADAEAQALEEAEKQTLILKRDLYVKDAKGDFILGKAGYRVMYFSGVDKYVLKSNNATVLTVHDDVPYDWCWVRPVDASTLLDACKDGIQVEIYNREQKPTPSEKEPPMPESSVKLKVDLTKESRYYGGHFSIWVEVYIPIKEGVSSYLWGKHYNGCAISGTVKKAGEATVGNDTELVCPMWYAALCADGTPKPANESPTAEELAQFWTDKITGFLNLWQRIGDLLYGRYQAYVGEKLKSTMMQSIDDFNILLNIHRQQNERTPAEKRLSMEDLQQARQKISDDSAAWSDHVRSQQD